MFDFSKYEKYVFKPTDNSRLTSKHVFFKLQEHSIEKAEERLNREFPKEIRCFYKQIGYGFLCKLNKNLIDRIMGPESIADFIQGKDRYVRDEYREMVDNEKEMVFFEVSEGSYLTLDLTHQDEIGRCPVLYFGKKVADSLSDFIDKMDIEADYYITFYP